MNNRKIYLIDASNLVYRAYYTFRNLKTKDGYYNGGLYGFISILTSYSQSLMTNQFVVVWDSKDTWRRDIYSGYKARRMEKKIEKENDEKEKNFRRIMKDVRRFCEYAGIISIKRDLFEADDLMAMATFAIKDNVSIVTADKDMSQLVNDKHRIEVIHPAKNGYEIWKEEQVTRHFGVEPHLLDIYLSLMGDSVDEVPGLKGYGKKTAQALVNDKPNTDKIFRHIGKKLGHEGIETLSRNYKLITLLNNDYLKSTSITPRDIVTVKPPDQKQLKAFLNEVEIRKFTAQSIYNSFCMPYEHRVKLIRKLCSKGL